MTDMARLEFGRLTDAWAGEATDFTPLLAQQLDALGDAIHLDLATVGESEVPVADGRRIDIVASDDSGVEFVIENQYGRADHDHLTRGLAYAVARRARGLVVVAEEHRDEFRAVAEYLNEMAETAPERGILVWLVEARAVRIENSPWAPLFTAVVEPNEFTQTVEQARQRERPPSSLEAFWGGFDSPLRVAATQTVVERWVAGGHRWRLGPNHIVLVAEGPSRNGFRSVVAIYSDGRVLVPFHSYAGVNSGIPVPALMEQSFRSHADALFGFTGKERLATTVPDWLTESTVDPLLDFCATVSNAYMQAMKDSEATPVAGG
jgi:hypothetical protein